VAIEGDNDRAHGDEFDHHAFEEAILLSVV
jgi:hypothetical protein